MVIVLLKGGGGVSKLLLDRYGFKVRGPSGRPHRGDIDFSQSSTTYREIDS